MADKPLRPPDPLTSDLEDLQEYAVSLFIEKLAISLGFAILSAFIVFITAMIYDARFMTAFFRAIIAFFVSGVAAALVSNVLDMQEDYYKMKSEEQSLKTEQTEQNENVEKQTDQVETEQNKEFKEQNFPKINNQAT